MNKKSHNTNTPIDTFAQQTAEAIADGYMMLPRLGGGADRKSPAPDSDLLMQAALAPVRSDGMFAGDVRPPAMPNVKSDGSILPTPDGVGSKGKGFVSWGADNRLPNRIAQLTGMSVYTATAVKFNADVLAGMGFVPKYGYTVVSNGALVTKEIDYGAAGALLEQQLIDARLELMKFYGEHPDAEENTFALVSGDGQKPSANSLRKAIEQSYLKRIARLEKEYSDWESTQAEITEFVRRNNLPLLALNLALDMAHFNICFPELELSRQATEQPDNALWQPKVTGITSRSALTCRMEEMDDAGRVNFIYHSNRWLDGMSTKGKSATDDIKAIPSLDPEHPATSMEQAVRDFKTSRANGSAAERPTRFQLPSYYPSAGHPYYPVPSWWSIFNGEIYNFLYNIVSDRAKRRKNKNIIGYVIYVHTEYLKQLVLQRQKELAEKNPKRKPGCNLTQAENKQLIDELFKTINAFISNRDNAGKPLLAYTFNGSDGKEHDAYRIVEIPNASASDAQAQKTELEEIAGIIAYACQCHPEVIGQVPGRTGAGGGTYQRELYLLKLLQMAPMQQLMLKALDTIRDFNRQDPHLFWAVRQQVLTTLDNSKTGLTESKVK